MPPTTLATEALTVVTICDDEEVLARLDQALRELGQPVEHLASNHSVRAMVDLRRAGGADLLFVSQRLKDRSGVQVLREVRRAGFQVPVILIAREGAEPLEGAESAFDVLFTDELESRALRRLVRHACERRELEVSLSQFREKLDLSNEGLSRRDREIQQIYHKLAHELRTPLTSIKEFVSLVADGFLGTISEKQAEFLTMARESCEKMVGHINQVTDVSRLLTNAVQLHQRSVDVGMLLDGVAAGFGREAEAKGLAVETSCAEGLPQVFVDCKRTNQVLLSILSNSLQFTEPGGRVDMSADWDPDRRFVRVSIRDNGRGMSRLQVEQAFDHLYQAEMNDTAVIAGMGLGLSICKYVMEQQGGAISIESTVGRGSTVHLLLPAAQ